MNRSFPPPVLFCVAAGFLDMSFVYLALSHSYSFSIYFWFHCSVLELYSPILCCQFLALLDYICLFYLKLLIYVFLDTVL